MILNFNKLISKHTLKINYHGGGCDRNTDNQFNCTYGFSFESIVDVIDKNL